MLNFVVTQSRTGSIAPCMWMFAVPAEGAGIAGADQAPAGLPLPNDLASVAADGSTIRRTVTANGTTYSVVTTRVHGQVRQAVFDERFELSDQTHLAWALLVAELAGLLFAGSAGFLLACRAIAPLDEALSRQRRFVADASHELRAPLTKLHTRTQMLLDDPDADLRPGAREELRRIVGNSRELGDIVDDLLRSASLSASTPTGEPVDLGALAQAVAAGFRMAHADVAVVVRADGTAGAPRHYAPMGSDLTVIGVRSALHRMISALVDNGIRHSPPGGRLMLTVDGRDRGRVVELVVRDEGAGFDPAERRAIFDRFHHGASGRYGLGLALVREIVDAHGGTVLADTDPGIGSTFTVRLPAARRLPGAVRSVNRWRS
jgi:signal transduction histidine kinase